jgi:hypothetical protein
MTTYVVDASININDLENHRCSWLSCYHSTPVLLVLPVLGLRLLRREITLRLNNAAGFKPEGYESDSLVPSGFSF